jgi:aquaporin Z
MEAAELGCFMLSACAVVTLLQHPASPVRDALPDPTARRVLTGVAMGLTAIAVVYSPWGKQSGAHFNPSVTLAFLRLGKIAPRDAAGYVVAHFVGAVGGVLVAAAALGDLIRDMDVNYAATLPGPSGAGVAFVAELVISFVLFTTVLAVSNRRTLNRYTGLCAGALVAVYISLEAPLSGMSMNPARSFGSAAPAGLWSFLWIYFTAPPLGMLLAAETWSRLAGRAPVRCAKLHHENDRRCIFRCGYGGTP